MTWRDQAACRGSVVTAEYDPFFTPELADEALRFCAACPVRVECGTEFADLESKVGVWAGVAPEVIPKRGRPKLGPKPERLELWQAGLCDREIAEIEGVSAQRIGGWRWAHGLELNHDPLKLSITPEVNTLRLERHAAGWTDSAIAEAEGVDRMVIAKWRSNRRLKLNKAAK